MKVLISGGGTGGHVYPAIAIAEKLKKENEKIEILYVGTKNGFESTIIPKMGYSFKTIEVQGFQRKINFQNIKRIFKAVGAVFEAKKIIKEFSPDLIIGTGGYVCGPVVIMGALLKKNTIIHEQNAFPGITNKILAKFVDKILISFEDARFRFKEQSKIILVGNPVREEILTVDEKKSRIKYKIPENKKMILSFGGSFGAKKLNNSMKEIIKNYIEKDIPFIHVTGKTHYENFIKDIELKNIKPYQHIVSYMDEMPQALAASDLVICSSGAITIAELTALGKASIQIPKAYTAENHQEFNALSIKSAGACDIILEKDLNKNLLWEKIESILNDEKILNNMSENSKKIGMPDALNLIYDQIREII